MISNNISVYSLKGNTIGILQRLEPSMFSVCDMRKESPSQYWEDNDLLLIGTSTYTPSYDKSEQFPKHLKKYEQDLCSLKGKKIILFGSGRSEYPNFCGALDYLYKLLSKNNTILSVYKFEGYPKEHQKEEFKNIVEGFIYE